MKNLLIKIWKDSVWSKVIATLLLAFLSIIYSLIQSMIKGIDFRAVLISFWTINIPLWAIVFTLITILIAIKIYNKNKTFQYEEGLDVLDLELYLNIRDKLLPQHGTISFLRTNNFAGFSFDDEYLIDIETFEGQKNNPNFHFFHPELDRIKNELLENIILLNNSIALSTFPNPIGRLTVPPEWEINDPERFKVAVNNLHTLSDKVCYSYDELYKKGRYIFKI